MHDREATSKKITHELRKNRTPLVEYPIEVENLSICFGNHTVLDNVSFKIKQGETMVVLGLSGTGKSTLLKSIIGLIRPTSGKVLLNGINIDELNEEEKRRVRERIGYAFQHGALFDSMNIEDNVAFGVREHTDLGEDIIQEIVTDKLHIVDLEGRNKLFPSELSGGMQKRAAFARTIATEPDIVFYDEPTSGLDPIMTTVIDDLIIDLQNRLGATGMVVTHDIRGALAVGSRLLLLHQGKIVWTGTPEDFKTTENPYLKQFRTGDRQGPIIV